MRGETVNRWITFTASAISIHSPHARGDVNYYIFTPDNFNFNPLPSCEGRPTGGAAIPALSDFNPLPSCEGRHPSMLKTDAQVRISIHSPHARGDVWFLVSAAKPLYFNPLPSCEGRLRPPQNRLRFFQFQSTPLMRGETACMP